MVEQLGRIRVIEDGVLLTTPFLDLTERVVCCVASGLLSLAFHPDFVKNGFLYVNYTDRGGDTRVVGYTAVSGESVADPGSDKLILRVRQPTASHNGGLVAFGPDGMLYIGMGDGHASGDPSGDAQNPGTLLGALLRIDVDGGNPYAIPPDNPFVGDPEARPEVWAYGLRNPWRFAFDAPAGLLYITDVGEHMWEEINIVPISAGGLNFGWNVMEGAHCFETGTCETEGLVLPVSEHSHDEACAIVGGYVYRGDKIPDLDGHYFFGDHCRGWIRSLRSQADGVDVQPKSLRRSTRFSFGKDSESELYVLTSRGRVHRIEHR